MLALHGISIAKLYFLYEILEVLCHLQRVLVSLEMLWVILQWAVRVCTAIGGVKKRKKSWESYERYTIRSEIGLRRLERVFSFTRE